MELEAQVRWLVDYDAVDLSASFIKSRSERLLEMGDQYLGDIVSNVRAIGAILERISVQSAGSTPLNDVTPESLVRQAANQQDKNSSWETVTTFITRLSALEKEIEASGSGRPVSRAGENSLERLRKGIHRAATSLGLAGRQEVSFVSSTNLQSLL